jgi:hypothetical protein
MPALVIIYFVLIGFAVLLALGPVLYFLGQVAFALFIFFIFFKFIALFSKMF